MANGILPFVGGASLPLILKLLQSRQQNPDQSFGQGLRDALLGKKGRATQPNYQTMIDNQLPGGVPYDPKISENPQIPGSNPMLNAGMLAMMLGQPRPAGGMPGGK